MQSVDDIAQACERDGYATIKQFFSESQRQVVESELERLLTSDLSQWEEGEFFYEAGTDRIRQLEMIERHSQLFLDLMSDHQFTEIAKRLFGEEPVCDNVSYMAKPAKVGSAVPPHQDNAYYNLVPDHGLTFWIALDPSTEDNGCMRVVQASHKGGILPHTASGIVGNSYGIAELPEHLKQKERAILLQPGDCSIHHSVTIHRSEANQSARSRRSLLLFFRGASCQVDEVGMDQKREAARIMYENMQDS